jgi:hypothetical protein
MVCCLAAALLASIACSSATSLNSKANTSTSSNLGQRNPSSGSVSEAKRKQSFILVNHTGGDIFKVFISPHSANDWQDDLLARNIQTDGESVAIKFYRLEKAVLWDLRVENREGQYLEWENLNLLESSTVTLYNRDGKATAKAE